MGSDVNQSPGPSVCRAVLPVTGMGNRLFVWARCKVFSHRFRLPMFDAIWPQLTLGPTLRRETDSRIYAGIFRHRQGGISYVRQLYYRARYASLQEPENWWQKAPSTLPQMNLITFQGFEPGFAPLNEHSSLISQALFSILRPKWQQWIATANVQPIVLHVRLGDFKPVSAPEDLVMKGNVRTPLHWYRSAISHVRRFLGAECGVTIFSNGRPGELEELLSLSNVTCLEAPNALTGIFAMAKAKVLIGSGGSSFSAWASFLGRMPTVVVPGQCLSWFKLQPRDNFLGTWSAEQRSDAFDEALITTRHLGDRKVAVRK